MYLGMLPDKYDSEGRRIVLSSKGEERIILSVKDILKILMS